MIKIWFFAISVLCLLLTSGSAARADQELRTQTFSRAQMQSMIQFLGSDLLEGRAPGTRGGRLAEAYIQSLFKLWDLAPGADGQYGQAFSLLGLTMEHLAIQAGGSWLKFHKDVMGTYAAQQSKFDLRGEAVFIGFGIATDKWKWDDFKGEDISNKIVIARVNDPGLVHADIFEGKVLTYFGRWTYHIEEAARRGAKAILLIHTDETAGYGWQVVENSWGTEALLLPADTENKLKFRGWIKESSLRRVLARKRINLDELYRKSTQPEFRPIKLGFQVRIRGRQQHRKIEVQNMVAHIPGKTKQRIVLSAHIDHLGMGPSGTGDRIYNGAIDNGSAVATMMLTAKALKQVQDQLYYSVTILACQAEESGLLGSRYYVTHTDRESIIANINFESTPVWEAADTIMGVGARFSSLQDGLKKVAGDMDLGYSEFSMTNQGFFFRSDQFSFARFGIPAIWISAGENDRSGKHKYPAFWKTAYHTVKDEYQADWPLDAMAQTIRATLYLIDDLNQSRTPPRWTRKLTFPTQ